MTPSTPLRLAVAAAIAFPEGGMTAAGLRKEHKRGNLRIWQIARKDFTTLDAIADMRERCLLAPKAPVCGCAPRAGEAKPSGSSATADINIARDAALLTVRRLREGSRNMSSPNIARRAGAAASPGKSRSPTC